MEPGVKLKLTLGVGLIGRGSYNKVRSVAELGSVVARTCSNSAMFMRELRLLKTVQECPGVVQLIASDAYQLPRNTMLLERLEGGMLLSSDSSSSPAFGSSLPGVATVLRMARQLLWALAAVHRCGVAHLDVKGSNLMIDRSPTDPNWQLKLIDFGLATSLRTPIEEVVRGSEMLMPPERLTNKGAALFKTTKSRFMAPATATDVYQKQDSWSAGITILEFAHLRSAEELGIDVMVLHENDRLTYTPSCGYVWSVPEWSISKCILLPRVMCSPLFPAIDTLCEPSVLARALPAAVQLKLVDIESDLGLGRRRPFRRHQAASAASSTASDVDNTDGDNSDADTNPYAAPCQTRRTCAIV